jgi:hypothetical protein
MVSVTIFFTVFLLEIGELVLKVGAYRVRRTRRTPSGRTGGGIETTIL